MPEADYHRHDISDKVWELLKPHLPGQRGQWGGIAHDNRRFINAVFFILRTGSTWRDVPPDYGKWGTVHQRFMRWQRKGTWKKILDILIDEPEYQFLMIDATHIKVHPRRLRRGRWKPRYGSHKRGLNSKIHLAVNEKGLPLAVSVTSGTVADCSEALSLIENLKAEGLIADRAYDTDEIITFSDEHYKIVVIPPKRNRKLQRDYDKEVYKMRHFVENVILDLKRWRGIATRYSKLTESFLAAVFCRCIAIWADYLV